MKSMQGNQDELDLSSSDDEEDLDPEARRNRLFEENLKKRIFYADRIEKVEKALIHMNLISKDIFFCSDFEFYRFTEVVG